MHFQKELRITLWSGPGPSMTERRLLAYIARGTSASPSTGLAAPWGPDALRTHRGIFKNGPDIVFSYARCGRFRTKWDTGYI